MVRFVRDSGAHTCPGSVTNLTGYSGLRLGRVAFYEPPPPPSSSPSPAPAPPPSTNVRRAMNETSDARVHLDHCRRERCVWRLKSHGNSGTVTALRRSWTNPTSHLVRTWARKTSPNSHIFIKLKNIFFCNVLYLLFQYYALSSNFF